MKLRTLALSGLIAAASATAAFAHHSNAMFDRTKTIDIKGTVREFQWTNPHTFIELEVPGAQGGATQRYTIEGPTPGLLRNHGWKFNSLKAGDQVVAKVHPLRDGSMGGGLVSVSVNGSNFVYEAAGSSVGNDK